MQIVGIICEYNPIHLGHLGHIEKTKQMLGECAIVCVMSGNYVQRGDVAVFGKHIRAAAAVSCGADLVLELSTPYVLSSAEGFAEAGVHILDKFGICDSISFGSENGDIDILRKAASVIVTSKANEIISQELEKGISYAAAVQKAADVVMGSDSFVLRSPNNLLGIEYLKALSKFESKMRAITVTRTGGSHDSDYGYSASGIRKTLENGKAPWSLVPQAASEIFKKEIAMGRGPIFLKDMDIMMLSRIRAIDDFSKIPNASEGLGNRFGKYAGEATLEQMFEKIKTKRYAMSRIRRMMLCAVLGITAQDTCEQPAYIRVLAMNEIGRQVLSKAKKKAELPIITKPASVQKLSGRAIKLFELESRATDFYMLAFKDASSRYAKSEWRQSPYIC